MDSPFEKGLPFLCLLLAVAGERNSKLPPSAETVKLVKDWAPVVWLHSGEQFFPSNVDFHIGNMEVRTENEELVEQYPTAETVGNYENGGRNLHFNTHDDLECVHCYVPHFFGEKDLSGIKNYILVKEWGDECQTVDASYPSFYPYNYGKEVCVGLNVSASCFGWMETFGNHVSDWEHSSIRFQRGKPTDMYVAVHSFGAKYAWNETAGNFKFYHGDPLRNDAGEKIAVDYPEHVSLLDGTNHPETFSANGSHGTWATEGRHTYFNFVVHLDDLCERGLAWNVWENAEIVDANLEDEDYADTELSWINFHGVWGNIEKLHCEFENLVGECGLDSGVGGPGLDFGMGHFGDPRHHALE